MLDGVRQAPRVRCEAVSARADGTRRRERRGERALPLGLPADDRRHAGRVPLREARRAPATAGPQALRGGGGHRLPDVPGRPPEQGPRGHPHGRVLDAPPRRGPPGLARHGRARGGLGRPRLRQAARGLRVVHLVRPRLERHAVVPQVAGGPLHGHGGQPVRDPHLRPPAVRGPRPGIHPRAVRTALLAAQHVGGAVEALDLPSDPRAPTCCSRASSSGTSPTTTARAPRPRSTRGRRRSRRRRRLPATPTTT